MSKPNPYGRSWQRIRQQQLNRQPLCEACNARGRIRAAQEVDHIVPLSDGGTNDAENLQSLCKSCHSKKTRAENEPSQFIGGGEAVAPVTIVCGPPAAGKTTFVRERKRWGDAIADRDALTAAISGLDPHEKPATLRPHVKRTWDALLKSFEKKSQSYRCWIIATLPKRDERAALARRFDAGVIVLETPLVVCLQRIAADPARAKKVEDWDKIVSRWWKDYQPDAGDTIVRA